MFLPDGFWVAQSLGQLWLPFPFERRPASFARLPLWGRLVQTGIQTQARDDAHTGQAAHLQQEIQHCIGPIGNHDQASPWHPVRDLQDHLPGPIRDRFMSPLALFMIALRGSQDGQKGQGPDPLRPRDGGSLIREIQRNPWVFTKNSLLERTGSR